MADDHQTWRLRVLGYEELEDDARRQADAHLAGCSECRELLDRLREIERQARPELGLPPLDAAESWPADEATRLAADDSLRALRGRLLPRGGRLHPTPRDWVRIAAPLALAVMAAVVLLSPRLTSRRIEIRDCGIVAAAGDRGGPVEPGPRRVWRTGEAFRLEFFLSRDGYPVVGHLDPRGHFELLYPETAAASHPRFSRGQVVRLPSGDNPLDWVFEGEPGPETFFVSATTQSDFDGARLVEAAAALAGENGNRAALVNRTRALLEARVGPVQVIEVEHAP